MKSTMQATAQAFGTISALLGIAIAPVSRDPLLIIVYASLAAAMVVTSVIFWSFFVFREDADEGSHVVLISRPKSTVQPETDVSFVATENR
jgi:proton-dependent oligopeptide transporter, POT family